MANPFQSLVHPEQQQVQPSRPNEIRESNRAVLYGRICNLFETYMPPRFPLSVYLRKLATVAVAVAASGDYHLLARDQCVARYLEGKIKCV
jgi:hypothetical protein